MGSKRSVATTVVLVLVSVITAGLVARAAVELVTSRVRHRAALQEQTAREADRLAIALTLPLWNLHDSQVDLILQGAGAEQEIFSLTVKTDERTFAFHRDGDWKLVEGPALAPPAGLLRAERGIVHSGQLLGTLQVAISPRFAEATARSELQRQVVEIAAIDLILVVALYLLLRLTVLRPLAQVGTFAAAVSRGTPARPSPPGRFAGELEELRASIEGMVGQLEARYAEAAASERRFRALFNGGADAAFVVAVTAEGTLGRLLEVNDVACRLLEEPRDRLLARPESPLGSDFLEPAALARTLRGERVVCEASLPGGDGRRVPVEVSSGLLEHQGARAVLLQARDLSERRRAEAERLRLENDLRQAQKVESIGRLAGGVAHDLNNLLCPILSYGGMLADELPAEDERRELAEDILRAGGRARDLVRQLLAFSRRQVLAVRPVDLNEVIRGLEKLLRRTLREDISIVLRLDDGLRAVRADPGQIEQVVINLAVNAGDAMRGGGTLTLQTLAREVDGLEAEAQGVAPGRYAMLEVADTGSGMDEETRRHAFEPFFTTKGDHGTGLGLATVFGIVKQHGGAIDLASQPGSGTRVTIHLPVTEEAPSVEAELPAPRHLDGRETVLLVDDDAQVRDAARTILARRGYQVLVARGGEEALALLQGTQARAVELVITDVVMPGMSGKQLLERARRAQPALKVLYMSGYTWEVVSHHGVLDAGTALLAKPFSAQTLAVAVREALDGGRQMQAAG